MTYTGDQIEAALTATTRTWDFRYERLTKDGLTLGAVEMYAVRVSHNALADIKRTCNGTLSPDAQFDFLSDRLRCYARLLMSDGGWQEWPLGTFLLSSTDTARGSDPTAEPRPVQGYDLLQVVTEDRLTARYIVAAGTNYVTAVNTVLTAAGFTSSTVASTTATLPAAMEWAPGISRLQVINDLLAAIGYTSLSMTALGIPTAGPYLDPESAPVLRAYTLDTTSLVRPGTVATLDLFNVPNVIIGVVSEPDRPVLSATATNSDPTSPLSTVRRGRSIVQVLDTSQNGAAAADLTVLQGLVDRALAEAGRQYETLSFTTGLMPIHDNLDVVTFDDGTGAVRYRETSWEMDLKAGGEMKHSARRSVVVG